MDSAGVSPRSRAAPWLVAGLACALSGGLGYMLGRRFAAPPPLVVREHARAADQRVDTLLAGQKELRARLLRLEAALAAGASDEPATVDCAAVAAPAEDEQAAPAPEAIAAFDSARRILDDAIRSGRWTDGDRARMRQTFAALGDEGRKTILQELAQALNSGKLSRAGLQGPEL